MIASRIILAASLAIAVIAPPASAQLTVQTKTHFGGKASSIVQLNESFLPNDIKAVRLVVPGVAAEPTTFVLPPKSVLVVTDFTLIRSSAGSASLVLGDNGAQRLLLSLEDTERVKTISLGSGLVFSDVPGGFNNGTAIVTVVLTGYLVKNK